MASALAKAYRGSKGLASKRVQGQRARGQPNGGEAPPKAENYLAIICSISA